VHEQRRQRQPTDLVGYLHQLPALLLLDRLPTAVLGVGPLGDIAYANPACAAMFGYVDGETMTHQSLPELLAGHSTAEPSDCLATVRSPDGIVLWNHVNDYVIRTKVSPTLLLRESDPLLLVSITDLTEWYWDRTNGHSP